MTRRIGVNPGTIRATQPTMSSFAKLSPEVSVTLSAAPTMPWPPRSKHSPVIRSIAVRCPS
jgi:hypothetical protein